MVKQENEQKEQNVKLEVKIEEKGSEEAMLDEK